MILFGMKYGFKAVAAELLLLRFLFQFRFSFLSICAFQIILAFMLTLSLFTESVGIFGIQMLQFTK